MQKAFLSLLVICILLFGGAFFWWKSINAPKNPKDSQPQDFLITRGQSVGQIGTNLEKQGLIKSALAFKLYTRLNGQSQKIPPGEFSLSPNMDLDKILLTLVAGPKELWVTLPEGIRREEIAAKVIKTLNLQTEKAQTFWKEFMAESKVEEGYLFPETYLFAKDVKAASVVAKLKSTFDSKFTEKMRADAQKAGLTMNQTVTLASLVEREAITDEERPIVAGILLKRLEAGWPLQVDATLQYAVAGKKCGSAGEKPILDCAWWGIPLSQDKDLSSAYNTYQNKGLPPGPIANPGIGSLQAAVYPEESEYWFYIHDNDEKIRYARTAEEHGANINKYLR
jgi:UPF0755 protein